MNNLHHLIELEAMRMQHENEVIQMNINHANKLDDLKLANAKLVQELAQQKRKYGVLLDNHGDLISSTNTKHNILKNIIMDLQDEKDMYEHKYYQQTHRISTKRNIIKAFFEKYNQEYT